MKLASSDARNVTALAISSGLLGPWNGPGMRLHAGNLKVQLSELVRTFSARVRPWRQPAGQKAAHTMTTRSGSWPNIHVKTVMGQKTKSSTRRSMPGPQSNSLHSNKPKQLPKHRRKCHNEQLQSIRHHFWIGYHDLCGRTRRASALCGCSRFSAGCNVPGLDYRLHLSRRSCPHPLTAGIRHVD